jgi:hypothetical protein
MRIILAGFLIIFGSFNLFAQSKITEEEYAVYSKIFESLYEKRQVAPDFQLVILDTTIKKSLYASNPENHAKRYLADIGNPFYKDFGQQKIAEILKDYNEKNSGSAPIKEEFKTKYTYKLISQNELDELLSVGKKLYDEMPEKPVNELHSPMVIWKPFLDQYRTDGCYSLSRIGFSKDKKLALVLFSRSQGIMGDDVFYILENIDGQWMNPRWFGDGISWII